MTSANIVGYDKAGLVNGFSIGGPCFAPVSKESFSIQELIPVDADGVIQYGGVFQLQTKNAQGKLDMLYAYVSGEDLGEETWPNGWYEEDYETFATKTFAAGEGFLFNSMLEGATLTYSGEVLTAPIKLPLVNGFSLMSNPRPVKVNIQNLIPVDANDEVQYGGVFQLQTKNAQGKLDMLYAYVSGEDLGEETWPNGWYEEDYETFATKEFEAGEGFLFNSMVTGGHLTLAKMAL